MKNSAINIDPEIMSSEPVFRGTRVTIKTLFDYLEEGDISDFLRNFPYISREMVTNVLKEVQKKEKIHKIFPFSNDKNLSLSNLFLLSQFGNFLVNHHLVRHDF